ncbi:MAG: muconolactone Delta-isomerase [Arenicella sp.]|nr:muconolactone Delta-isomerase [Arenicella sp.]
MLFKVEMDVNVPQDIDPTVFERTKAKEKKYAEDLQASGKWRHLWRIVGQYKNISVFDVESSEELHNILMGLPLYPYMDVRIEALCRHPSSVRADDS